MVRIMIKGGVWKNTEDEILKAAVMKYGKNQWSRVASLLNRKSAKQCKARWYEWLDPSIKKTEWTREEEEKLLHLAKLYPSQWRTLAPIVGRTAAQCMEHYEHLLDAAQSALGGEGAGVGLAEEARKLRPGEIDPHPETKPARPDPMDMDEDEQEMLAEARARLANTRGKKAKRKAREKQLEEAKRLANLQKRRELKAAGVEKKAGKRKRKYMDYGAEIPFQRAVPAGFYAVDDERDASAQLSKLAANKDFEVQRLDQLEGKRREKEEKDAAREDRKKIRKIEAENPASLMAQVSKHNDPMTYRARTALSLPAPQVGDAELEAVLKVGNLAMVTAAGAGGAGTGSATSGLVGDPRSYAAALPTPQRTPRAAMGSDVVLQEARNQLAMRDVQTPLLGGETPILQEGTGFAGSAPKGTGTVATPNALTAAAAAAQGTPLGTPLMLGGNGGGGRAAGSATPLDGAGGGTPLRDDLSLNQGNGSGGGNGGLPPGMSAAAAARYQKMQLSAALSNLPEPQYAYEIEVPDLPTASGDDGADGRGGSALSVEDAAERDARAAAAQAAALEAELARRSAAVRRGLPRPFNAASASAALTVAAQQTLSGGGSGSGDPAQQADALVRAEMATLLAHDGAKYPVEDLGGGSAGGSDKDAKKRAKKARKEAAAAAAPLEDFEDDELSAARALVAAELQADPAASAAAAAAQEHVMELGDMWSETQEGFAYLPERQSVASLTTASAKERLSSLAWSFENCRGHMAKHAEKCAKLEKKLQVRTMGYEDKAASLREQCAVAHASWSKKSLEEKCFATLASAEAIAGPQRIADLYDLTKQESERNEVMQAQYKALLLERDRLTAAFAHAAQQAQ